MKSYADGRVTQNEWMESAGLWRRAPACMCVVQHARARALCVGAGRRATRSSRAELLSPPAGSSTPHTRERASTHTHRHTDTRAAAATEGCGAQHGRCAPSPRFSLSLSLARARGETLQAASEVEKSSRVGEENACSQCFGTKEWMGGLYADAKTWGWGDRGLKGMRLVRAGRSSKAGVYTP